MPPIRRLLLVEDDPNLSKLLASVLGIEHQVNCAVTLSEARKLIATHQFDAILLDKTLPDGNGEEWLLELDAANFPTPILMLSGDSDFGSVRRCLAAGAVDYLVKGDSLLPDLMIRLPIALELRKSQFPRFPSRRDDISPENFRQAINTFQKGYIEAALKIFTYNVSELAKQLGISRATLFNRINELEISRPGSNQDEQTPRIDS